jgi:hypothetical protein
MERQKLIVGKSICPEDYYSSDFALIMNTSSRVKTGKPDLDI